MDALREKRRKAIALLDDLAQSIFLDMFENPNGKTGRWPSQPLGQVASFYAGTTLPVGVSYSGQEGGYLLLKVGDLNLPENSEALQAAREWSSHPGVRAATCPAGSVVIPKRGGAIATNKKRISSRPCVLDPNLMAISPHIDVLTVEYLYQWFKNFDLMSISNGSSVPQLNKKDLSPLNIPVPSIDIQRTFGQALTSVSSQVARLQNHLAQLDALFSSLQSRAFRGELWHDEVNDLVGEAVS
ncbi:restriction endonuclease subunit S [Nocardia veterana]|uniref:Type I restriction modification DNA specificity domain-containing protein n=1 Tax=Nocardia veterana TaxID=132249 RepID=A0A7X6RLI0_9NOCA|nr:restriction endonuclease subunit S [Nocardia veterana]NKY89783.1 hypothetical protein [Nocardia veterana]